MTHMVSIFAVYIAIFLFGMFTVRIGLETVAKKKLKAALIMFTETPLKGLITGTIATGLLQSSSVVLVLTVGLVASSYLTFKQSIGIILGANIGTTLTAEILTFDIGFFAPFLLIIGVALLFFKRPVLFGTGAFLFGFGCIFVAMGGFETSAEPLTSLAMVQQLIAQTEGNLFIALGIGTFLTAIIQSSTAVTAIVMGFMTKNIITLPAGIAIVLGANIGTCVTALLASIGSNVKAKLVAYAHIWLNLFGVILFFPFIPIFAAFVQLLASSPDVQIAHASFIFNILTSLLVLPMAGKMSRFLLKLHHIKD